MLRYVDTNIADEELVNALRAKCARVLTARRLGRSSETVRVVFEGTSLPEDVTIGSMHHKVHEYKTRAIQCRQCHKFGHTADLCRRGERCECCGGEHDSRDCHEEPRCVNCKRSGAKDPHCSARRRENDIARFRARHANATREDAKEATQKTYASAARESGKHATLEQTQTSQQTEHLRSTSHNAAEDVKYINRRH